ncbi:FAD-dependent oxidoreductase [Terriglobus sp. TAA 43]|uniref:FAD-dependent oxidoreductase n=1 Tax=Terriglobus sp. TAA 43 TaxID=278961 RepID=UPI0006469E3A|nr:FAD-dependent oxidoreductase [Terriglobus sp. TAA 43]
MRWKQFATAILATLSISTMGWGATPRQFDVVVYGTTASGVIAAISAARHGMNVALVGVDQHLGGMVTGGLSHSDRGKDAVIGGMSREFFERVGKHYNETLEWNFEPRVAEQVFHEMLNETKVVYIPRARLKEHGGVTMSKGDITSIALTNGDVLRAKVFMDTSYEGDLMNEAGVKYTWGREPESEYNESIAGVRGRQRPDHHFNVPVSPWAAPGKLLPEVQNLPRGPMGSGDKYVQAYGFRMCLTNVKENMIPFPKPPGYDAYRYELLKRYLAALEKAEGHPPHIRELMIMSPLPNGKFDINSFGGFSTDHIGANWDYPSGSYARQKEIWQDHYNYDAGFFYFLANDASVPKALHDEVNGYGLAKDEFLDEHGWPFQLYVREGRRMLGEYVMTQKDITTNVGKPDSIGMGSYQSDSHHVRRIPTPDGYVENEGEQYVVTKPYEIPYRVMLPNATQVKNLLVPVCFSASHVAYSTIRMEPQYMILGQAAGVAAAIAVHDKLPVARVPVKQLQGTLRSEKAVLSLPQ